MIAIIRKKYETLFHLCTICVKQLYGSSITKKLWQPIFLTLLPLNRKVLKVP